MEKLNKEDQELIDEINSKINDILIFIKEFDNYDDTIKIKEYDTLINLIKDVL